PSLVLFISRLPPRSSPFPYTTLFRSPTAVNALLIVGDGITPITLGGAGQLFVGSGLVVADGAGIAINTPVAFGGATGLIVTPNLGSLTAPSSTLDFGGAIDGQAGIVKLGYVRETVDCADT